MAEDREYLWKELTEEIIGAAYQVANTLGNGFLEKVYENALAIELRKRKVSVEQQHSIAVKYEGQTVGEYVADLLVDGKVIVEVKAVSALDRVHEAQCLNYLKATGLKVGLLLNFGKPKIDVRRLVV